MAKHLIAFGHSPGGTPDPGTTSGSLKEAIEEGTGLEADGKGDDEDE